MSKHGVIRKLLSVVSKEKAEESTINSAVSKVTIPQFITGGKAQHTPSYTKSLCHCEGILSHWITLLLPEEATIPGHGRLVRLQQFSEFTSCSSGFFEVSWPYSSILKCTGSGISVMVRWGRKLDFF